MKYLIIIISFIFLLSCTKSGKNVTLKGRVLNPITGDGIAGAEIWLQKTAGGYNGGWKTVKKAVSNGDGNFVLEKIGFAGYAAVAGAFQGEYFELGWTQDQGATYTGNFKIWTKIGKTMHADYYALQYGEIKISFHNINCGGSNDTFIFNRTYHSLPNVSVFQPMTFTGCVDNDGAFAKVPNGDYLIEWTVIKSGISNSYSHIMTVPPNGQASFNIDY